MLTQVQAYLTSAFTIPSLLFNVDETWRRILQAEKEISLVESKLFAIDQSAVQNLVVKLERKTPGQTSPERDSQVEFPFQL